MLRYHEAFFGSHSSDQIPVYIANKALSFAALLLIALAIAARPLAGWKPGFFANLKRDRRAYGLWGFGFAAVHALLSLVILTPAYFDKLYRPDNHMTLAGEVSILAGTVAMVLLVWQSRLPASGDQNDPAQAADQGKPGHRVVLRRLGLAVLGLTLVHVVAIGWSGWLAVDGWPGALPPITLLSAVVAAIGLVMGVLQGGRRGR